MKTVRNARSGGKDSFIFSAVGKSELLFFKNMTNAEVRRTNDCF